jgi:hypothetical protein
MPRTTAIGKLKITTFEAPPAGFDPRTASDDLLARHGWPARPDAKTSPRLRMHWERAFGGKLTYVAPDFRRSENKVHGPRQRVEGGAIANATSSNWSGSVVLAPSGSAFQWVIGSWTVPNPYAPAADGKTYYASEWIGIDGWSSNDVFQAGTETEATASGNTTTRNSYLWWEWYPENEVAITSMSASPGDEIVCLLVANSTTSGSVFLANLGNGTMTSFTITPPAGTTLIGNSAEWVAERPGIDGSLSTLVDYGVVYFDRGVAAYATGRPGSASAQTQLDAGNGSLVSMTDAAGAVISSPTSEAATLIKVEYGSGYDESKWIKALYADLLGRAPDPNGLESWLARRLGGMSLNDVANGFLNSAEYCGKIVTGFYQQFLSRAPDAGGLQGWTSQLEKPTAVQQIIVGFCDSGEYKTDNPPPDQFVESLYVRLLGRPSDPAGKAGWVNALTSGQSTATVINGFLDSQEYCTDRVTGLYQTLLGRAPDAPGLAGWVGLMTAGAPFQQIQRGFLTSEEYRARALSRF